jgi:ATP-dependent helicase/nuclease subunit A
MSYYHKASNPAYNVWVSASAGSGKTKTLTDRFIRLLLNGVKPEKILCITFTKVAALEMLTRIKEKLGNWTLISDDLLGKDLEIMGEKKPNREDIKKARGLFYTFVDAENTLQIQTIHSFCQKILAIFPFESGIGLNHSIINDLERQIILTNTKYRFLENYEEETAHASSINFLLGSIHDSTLDKLIDQAISMIEITNLKEEKLEYLTKAKNVLDIHDNIENDIEELKNNLRNILLSCRRSFIEANCIEITKFIMPLDNIQNAKDLFLNKDGRPRKQLLSKKTSDLNPKINNMLRNLQDLVFSIHCKENNLKTFKLTSSFLDLAELFNQYFTQHKRQNNLIDYNDLINLCTDLLNNKEMSNWVERKLNSKVEHILVDEAQDINLKQWQVINACMKEFFTQDIHNTIFIVGDQKQSIYSFQGSSSELFNGMRHFIDNHMNSYSVALEEINFTTSFRSDDRILSFIDKVFAKISKINADHFCEENLKHSSNKSFTESSVELWPLAVKETEDKTINAWKPFTEYPEITNEKKKLADMIADKIESLIHSGNFCAKDFMILVRKRDQLIDHMVRALKAKSIPVNGVDRINLRTNIAIQDLLSLVQFILLPNDDYNLACLLKSPMFSISEDNIFLLCQRDEKTLWENLEDLAKTKPHFQEIYITLKEILDNQNLHSPYKLIYYCLDIKNYRDHFIKRLGSYINEVFEEFLNLCIDFESKHQYSLLLFLEWFKNCNVEIKKDTTSSKDEVKIMTIHGAKGMQARFVILPDTTSIPKSQETIVFDRTQSIILYKNSNIQNSKYQSILEQVKLQTLQEYYRLLYVGLTRAEQHLLICGHHTSGSLSSLSWYSIIEDVIKD